jgi:hypothetical protein
MQNLKNVVINHPIMEGSATKPRKLVPGNEIKPLSVKDFDTCHIYLRGIVFKHYKEARMSFRALQLPDIFRKHSAVLIETAKSVYEGDAENVTFEAVHALFINPHIHDTLITKALAEKINEIAGLSKKDINTEGVDEELKKYALDSKDCPKIVIDLAYQRPSVFHVMASDDKYRREIISLFRCQLMDNENGAGKSTATLIQEAAPLIYKVEK